MQAKSNKALGARSGSAWLPKAWYFPTRASPRLAVAWKTWPKCMGEPITGGGHPLFVSRQALLTLSNMSKEEIQNGRSDISKPKLQDLKLDLSSIGTSPI